MENLASLEASGGEMLKLGASAAEDGPPSKEIQGTAQTKESAQMVVYKPPDTSDGKSARVTPSGTSSWPWAMSSPMASPPPNTQPQGPSSHLVLIAGAGGHQVKR